ncbi:MAG TPA: glycosyltransferase family 4 protein, partial [Planctomycetota bacterium]|nr:glycosyltransferase family 4 protein [Planctomycetota bacterium]
MKWLHILGHLRPGGVELRLIWTIQELRTRHTHAVMSLDGSLDVLEMNPGVRAAVRVVESPAGGTSGGISTMRAVARAVHVEKPDAVLTYGWGAFDAVLWSVLSRSRVPVVHHEDGFTASEVAHMPRRRTLARRIALRRIAGTVVPSTTLAATCRESWRIPSERIIIAPNGVRAAICRDRVNLHERFGIPLSTSICISVGRLAAVKRMDHSIEAAAEAGMALIIVGTGPEEDVLRSTVEHVGGHVYFAGLQEDVRPWLRGADVYLSTSMSEQHPIAMLEGMDESLPVVATDVGDVAQSLPTPQHRFVVPADGSVSLVASRLMELRHSSQLRESLGRQNKERVESDFRFGDTLRAMERAVVSVTRVGV